MNEQSTADLDRRLAVLEARALAEDESSKNALVCFAERVRAAGGKAYPPIHETPLTSAGASLHPKSEQPPISPAECSVDGWHQKFLQEPVRQARLLMTLFEALREAKDSTTETPAPDEEPPQPVP